MCPLLTNTALDPRPEFAPVTSGQLTLLCELKGNRSADLPTNLRPVPKPLVLRGEGVSAALTRRKNIRKTVFTLIFYGGVRLPNSISPFCLNPRELEQGECIEPSGTRLVLGMACRAGRGWEGATRGQRRQLRSLPLLFQLGRPWSGPG